MRKVAGNIGVLALTIANSFLMFATGVCAIVFGVSSFCLKQCVTKGQSLCAVTNKLEAWRDA